MSKPLLSLSNLSVSYGKVEAVRGVSLEVFAVRSSPSLVRMARASRHC